MHNFNDEAELYPHADDASASDVMKVLILLTFEI